MKWNWQKPDWPHFQYDSSRISVLEGQFLHQTGVAFGATKHFDKAGQEQLLVELMGDEAFKTSEIEGILLNRQSLQSSIRKQFGLTSNQEHIPAAEQGVAQMMFDLHENFAAPLSHDTLFHWHEMLMSGRDDIDDIGAYRTHHEPMQVVSGAIYKPTVHFEAPASKDVLLEMTTFIKWFNGSSSLPALTRASIAHLYFVCIHPFEDGNGRIGRALCEKVLAQSLGRPTLISLSHTIQANRKDYYNQLELNNKTNEISAWMEYFAQTILDAQAYSQTYIDFLIQKTKIYDRIRNQLNARQEKVLERMFREGPKGFKGGLSARNYIAITGTTRATATRDLTDLLNKKVFKKTGQLKGVRYWLDLSE